MARIKLFPAMRSIAEGVSRGSGPGHAGNWAKAIGAFERTLVTPSRFDAFLAGDTRALSPEERTGLRKFIDTGCTACHNGADVGGGIFQSSASSRIMTATRSQQPDKGRFDVTHDPQDTYVFKVPSLRNVAMTPPISIRLGRALPEAVRIMAKVQLGRASQRSGYGDIVAFLGSLTGKLRRGFVEAPILPASGLNVSQTEAPQ